MENGNPDAEEAYNVAVGTANANAAKNYIPAAETIADYEDAQTARANAEAGLEAMGLRYDRETGKLMRIGADEPAAIGNLDIPALLTAYEDEPEQGIAAVNFLTAISGDIDAIREAYPEAYYGDNGENLWDAYDQFAEFAGEGVTGIEAILNSPSPAAARIFAGGLYQAMRGYSARDPRDSMTEDQKATVGEYMLAITRSDETLDRISEDDYNNARGMMQSIDDDYAAADETYATFSGRSRDESRTGSSLIRSFTGTPSNENPWNTRTVMDFAFKYGRNYQATNWDASSFYSSAVGMDNGKGGTYSYEDVAASARTAKTQNDAQIARIDYVLGRIKSDGLPVSGSYVNNLQRERDRLKADNAAADYFLLREDPKFDEVVASFNLDEVGKDNPIYIKERGWITTAFGIVGEAFTRKAQKAQAMSDDEARTYKYLYVADGEEAAEQYLTSLDNALTMRVAQEDSTMYERMSHGWGAIPMNVLSILESPTRISGTAYSAFQLATGQEINPYSNFFSTNRLSQGTQAGTKAAIHDVAGEGKLGDFFADIVYGGLYSAGESFVGSMAFGGIGGALGITTKSASPVVQRIVMALNEVTSAVPMGISAAGDAMQQAAMNGASPEQIGLIGLTTAAAESVSEGISFGNMDKARNLAKGVLNGAEGVTAQAVGTAFREWMKELPLDTLAEVLGESSNEFVESISDQAIMGEMSEWQQNYDSYISSGMTPAEAEHKANMDVLKGCVYAGASAIVSTFAGGAASVTSQTVQEMRTGRQTRQQQMAEQFAPAANPVQAPGVMTSAEVQEILHTPQAPDFAAMEQAQQETTQEQQETTQETPQEQPAPTYARNTETGALTQTAPDGTTTDIPMISKIAEAREKSYVVKEVVTDADGKQFVMYGPADGGAELAMPFFTARNTREYKEYIAAQEQASQEQQETTQETTQTAPQEQAEAPILAMPGSTTLEAQEALHAPAQPVFAPTEQNTAPTEETQQTAPQGQETAETAEETAEEQSVEPSVYIKVDANDAGSVKKHLKRLKTLDLLGHLSFSSNGLNRNRTSAYFAAAMTEMPGGRDQTAVAAAQKLASRSDREVENAYEFLNRLRRAEEGHFSFGAYDGRGVNHSLFMKYAALGNGECSRLLEDFINPIDGRDPYGGGHKDLQGSKLESRVSAAIYSDMSNADVQNNVREATRKNRVAREVARMVGDGALNGLEPYQTAVTTARQAADNANERLETSRNEQEAVNANLEAASENFLADPTDQLARGQYQQAVNDVTSTAAVVKENEQSAANANAALETAKGQLKKKQAQTMEDVRQKAEENVNQQIEAEEQAAAQLASETTEQAAPEASAENNEAMAEAPQETTEAPQEQAQPETPQETAEQAAPETTEETTEQAAPEAPQETTAETAQPESVQAETTQPETAQPAEAPAETPQAPTYTRDLSKGDVLTQTNPDGTTTDIPVNATVAEAREKGYAVKEVVTDGDGKRYVMFGPENGGAEIAMPYSKAYRTKE